MLTLEQKNTIFRMGLVASLIVLYIVMLLNSQDNDMFFEIVSGRDLLDGNFKTASHLNNFPIIVQQWLYSVCLAIVDNYGKVGHIVFVFIQNTILYILTACLVKFRTNSIQKALFIPAVSLLICSEYMINIRPQIITVILLIAEILCLEYYSKYKKFRYLIIIIPILILAANMHQAVFLYHIFIICPYIIDTEKCRIDIKLALMSILYTTLSILTPYGINGATYIVKTFKSNVYNMITINELQPVSIKTFVGIKWLGIFIVMLYLLYKHRMSFKCLFYSVSIILLMVINVRHASIMYISVIFILMEMRIVNILDNKYIIGNIIFLCLGSAMLISLNLDDKDMVSKQNIVNNIENKHAAIYNSAMDLGGYLEYNGFDNIALDSRCEAFIKENSGIDNVIEDYILISRGYKVEKNDKYILATDEDILNKINNYEYAIAKNNQYVNRILHKESNWKCTYEDSEYAVYKNIQE